MVTWVLSERSTPEQIHLLRLAQFDSKFSFERNHERLHVMWSFRSGSNNAPTDADLLEMSTFENLLCDQLEALNIGQLVAVFTEPGYREYVFYTNNINAFMKTLNSLPDQTHQFPIEIHCENDANGEFYSSYANSVLGAS